MKGEWTMGYLTVAEHWRAPSYIGRSTSETVHMTRDNCPDLAIINKLVAGKGPHEIK